MLHSLVTFLGKSRLDPKTGYSLTTYRFEDGSTEQTPFFGLALARHISPDRLVILGTASSTWDLLAEHVVPSASEEDLRLELIYATADGRVTQQLLDRCSELIARALGCACALRLMRFGQGASEQMEILHTVAAAIPEGRVSFDLTHGFRHLAALGLLSAFFLERVAHIEIAGLYYGAWDMKQGSVTPVVRLDGLHAIQRWIDALDRFDASGDYGVFADLLVADGVAPEHARCLERAAFYERTSNAGRAREQILTFLNFLEDGLPGTAKLFEDRLRERLAWARSSTLSEHQRHLARVYLARGDFLRAAIFGWEAVITRECERRNYDVHEFEGGRASAEEEVEAELREGRSGLGKAYWKLKDLRNGLAHGNPARRKDVQNILSDDQRLPRELQELFGELRL